MVSSPLRWALAALLVTPGCGPDVPAVERPRVVHPVFDPAAQELPTPNDLALDAEGHVALAEVATLSAAENALRQSFNGFAGFSAGASARVRFTAPVSVASLTEETVLAFDLGEAGRGPTKRLEVRREYSDCDGSLSLVSPAGLEPSHRYLFALRSGAQGVRGAGGELLAPTPAFHLLRAGRDLRSHLGAVPGATLAERSATAERLEAARQRIEPLLRALEEQGLPRQDVAVAWSFTVRADAEALYDPATARIPMPNDLLRDEATGRVTLPLSPADSPESAALKRGFSKLDGFSLTGALTVDFSAPLQRSTAVAGRTVRLFEVASGSEVRDLELKVSESGTRLSVQPLTPLLPATRYALVVAGLDSVRGPLAAMPLSTLLTLPHPIADDEGKSLLSSFCDDTARKLEALRSRLQPLMDALARPSQPEAACSRDGDCGAGLCSRAGVCVGAERERIVAAVTFTTQDILSRAQALREAPERAQLPLSIDVETSRSPLELGLVLSGNCLQLPPSRVARVVAGRFTSLDYLEPTTHAFREDDTAVPSKVPFILSVPSVPAGAPLPVVVFGHGLYTERRFGLFLAERLARAGYATLTIDLPLHGERSACVQDAHCVSGATCAADGVCVQDGKPAQLARYPSPWPGLGAGMPVASGQAFVEVGNLFASRDHFRQAYVDLSALTRLLRAGDWRPVTGGHPIDTSRIHYVGLSLGAIIGGAMSGVDPTYPRMLLNVGGAGLVDLMRESSTFGPQLTAGLAEKGIDEGTAAYDAFLNASRWALDEVDPLNLAPYALRRPLRYVDLSTGMTARAQAKRLYLQMAVGDVVVPNSSTERLVKATGIDRDTELTEYLGASHAFLNNPAEQLSFCAGQDELVDFLEAGR